MFQESFPLTDKTCFLYGNPQPSHLLIQPVGAQDLSGGLEKEVACLKKMAGEDFLLAAFDIRNWNQELSPWEAPPVWGTEAFGNGAAETLDFILRDLLPELKRRFSLFSELPMILGGLFPGGTFFPLGRLSDRCFLRHCRCLSLCLVSGLDGVRPFPTHPNRTHLSQPR